MALVVAVANTVLRRAVAALMLMVAADGGACGLVQWVL